MIATSPDGQWAAVRRGREVALLAGGAGPATSSIEIDTDDADMVIVGPPSVLAVVTRAPAGGGKPRMVLYLPPYLDAVAQLDLEGPMRVAAVTGPRVVLLSPDGKAVTVVRIAGRALSAQVIETPSPVEFAVGLERNQVLFGLLRKLEAWDAVSGRPLLRMQLPLPPPPRLVGPAHGHVWAVRVGGDEVLVCRLSDGRPFQHQLGASILDVVHHPASPLLILVTARGLVRLHCFAHALTSIESPWLPGAALAQLVVGDDIALLGMAEHDDEPWRVPIAGANAPPLTLEAPDTHGDPLVGALDRARAVRHRMFEMNDPAPPRGSERDDFAARFPPAPADSLDGGRAEPGLDGGRAEPAGAETARFEIGRPDAGRAEIARLDLGRSEVARIEIERADAGRPGIGHAPRGDGVGGAWREAVAALGAGLARGGAAEVPEVAVETELGQLAHRLALGAAARHALVVLYGAHLVGDPAQAIAGLAAALGEWTEALGQGELGTLAMLRRRGGKVALRGAVTDLLDGVEPRAIRVVGNGTAFARAGAARLERGGRTDGVIERELARQFGRIAVIEGGAAVALLEARLHGAMAVALAAPPVRPLPWPRDAGLIVVTDTGAPAWTAALPSFTGA